MAFTTFTVVAKPSADGTGVAVSLKKIKSTSKAILGFTFRPAIIEKLGWSDGATIEVALGEDDHHGLLRIRPSESGTAVLNHRQAGGAQKRGGPYFSLSLGHVPLYVDRSEPKKWVTFEAVEDGWLEIVLPRWADETSPKGVERKRQLTGGPAAVAPTPRPTAVERTGALMGDPPPGRSALAQQQPSSRARRAAAVAHL